MYILKNSENKLLNQNLYVQNLIRQVNPTDGKNKVFKTDNYSNIQKLSSTKNYFIGFPINNQNKILTNQYNKNFKISTLLATKNLDNKKFLKGYIDTFNKIKKNNKKANFITLTHVIKGGAYGLTSGIIGFIPRSQYYRSLKTVLNNKTITLKNVSALNKLRKIITLKIPLKETNLSLYPTQSLNKFTRNTNIKKHYPKNNIVFAETNKETKNYENKKKTRKYKNELLFKREKKFHTRKN